MSEGTKLRGDIIHYDNGMNFIYTSSGLLAIMNEPRRYLTLLSLWIFSLTFIFCQGLLPFGVLIYVIINILKQQYSSLFTVGYCL